MGTIERNSPFVINCCLTVTEWEQLPVADRKMGRHHQNSSIRQHQLSDINLTGHCQISVLKPESLCFPTKPQVYEIFASSRYVCFSEEKKSENSNYAFRLIRRPVASTQFHRRLPLLLPSYDGRQTWVLKYSSCKIIRNEINKREAFLPWCLPSLACNWWAENTEIGSMECVTCWMWWHML